jgi:hypothetical protein
MKEGSRCRLTYSVRYRPIDLDQALVTAVADFRFDRRVRSEVQAVRLLMEAGLDALLGPSAEAARGR